MGNRRFLVEKTGSAGPQLRGTMTTRGPILNLRAKSDLNKIFGGQISIFDTNPMCLCFIMGFIYIVYISVAGDRTVPIYVFDVINILCQ